MDQMPYRETLIRGRVNCEHVVQLFDSADTRADAVATFLNEGYQAGDTLLVAITKDHWERVSNRLKAAGMPLRTAIEGGQLTVRDAAALLDEFMRSGTPDPQLFARSLGDLVQQLSASGKRLRIYGEIVDLLTAEGDFRSAQILEDFWNSLSEQHSFTLFCGYGAVNFGDPRSGSSLRSICRSHSLIRSNPRDLLGSFLVHAAAAQISEAVE
jgi:hypothetical protein